jgi:hypothetical protein
VTKPDISAPVSRRRALALGGGLLGGLVAARAAAAVAPAELEPGSPPAPAPAPAELEQGSPPAPAPPGRLPVGRMRAVLPLPGAVSGGVLSFSVVRSDVGPVARRELTLSPAFALAGGLAFQPAGRGRALLIGDLPVRPAELPVVTAAIGDAGLVLASVHQRSHDMASGTLRAGGPVLRPEVWFVHWWGSGDPLALARAARAVLDATALVLPHEPSSPAGGPLDAERLRRLLRGYHAATGPDGVVSVRVARRHGVDTAGVRACAETNLATTVSFQPLPAGAAVGAEVAMAAGEVAAAMRVMRAQGWDLGALYRRLTGERPRLSFAYHFKVGEAYACAGELRRGLDETDST